jgi:hypothetical protein
MSTFRCRIACPSPAIVAALVLAVPLSFTAVAGATIKTAPPKTTGISGNELSVIKGQCPKGTSVVSGGFSAPDFFTAGSFTVRTSSVKAGKRGWRVGGAGLGEIEGRMLAHAYCDTEGLALKVRKSEVSVPAGQTRTAVASCRKDESVVSGGFATPGFATVNGPQIAVLSSMRKGNRRWIVEGASPDDTLGGPYPPSPLVAYAYCSDDAPKIAVRAKTLTVQPSDPVGYSVDARCRGGSRAIAGGFRGHLDIGPDHALGSTAVSSTRLAKGRGWHTQMLAVAKSGPVPLTGFAYCVK